MKLLVHIGLHRAASTSLQTWLRAREQPWAARRIFVQSGLTAGSPFAVLASRHLAAMGPKAAGRYVAAVIDDMAADFDAGIVSDENLLGPMPAPGHLPFVNADALCRALGELALRHQVIPVIVLRDHARWLESLYRTFQLRGGTRNFGAFTRAVQARDIRFAPLLDSLQELGPAIVDSAEQAGSDGGKRLLERITSALGLESVDGSLGVENRAPPPLHLRITAALGRHKAMLAFQGGPEMVELVAAPEPERLARHVQDCAVTVPWAQTPARRMHRAQVIFKQGTPPALRLPMELCREIVAGALAPSREPSAILPLAAFAADRQTIAERYLPEWRR